MPRTAGVLRGLCFCCGCCCWLSLAAAAAAVDDDQLQAANHGLVCIPHWHTFHGAVHLGTMWRACIMCGAVGSGTADVLVKTWTVVIRVQICKFHLAVGLSKRSARKTNPNDHKPTHPLQVTMAAAYPPPGVLHAPSSQSQKADLEHLRQLQQYRRANQELFMGQAKAPLTTQPPEILSVPTVPYKITSYQVDDR